LLGIEPGYFVFYVGTAPDQVDTCIREFSAELDRLVRDGLTEEDLARAKNDLIGQQRIKFQNNADLSFAVGLDELYGLGYKHFLTTEERYRAVTLADIKRVAGQYFAGRPRAVVVVHPPRKEK